MAERKPIHIEPESDTAKLLRLVRDEPVSVESGGVEYRIERRVPEPFADYDPEKVLEALHNGIGLYEGVDTGAFKREILEQRSQAPRKWASE
ncbi:MAG: hypothetical protein KF883_02285 [Thermomicrobiales bacterium]|nr:hypothetical protein [Thermomicrobiales bacterium]